MAHFARRHYEAVARVMQDAFTHAENAAPQFREAAIGQTHNIMQGFVDAFHRDNDGFDVGRFERACRPGANVRNRVN